MGGLVRGVLRFFGIIDDKPPRAPDPPPTPGRAFSLSAADNALRPGGQLGYVCGSIRVAPDVAGNPYKVMERNRAALVAEKAAPGDAPQLAPLRSVLPPSVVPTNASREFLLQAFCLGVNADIVATAAKVKGTALDKIFLADSADSADSLDNVAAGVANIKGKIALDAWNIDGADFQREVSVAMQSGFPLGLNELTSSNSEWSRAVALGDNNIVLLTFQKDAGNGVFINYQTRSAGGAWPNDYERVNADGRGGQIYIPLPDNAAEIRFSWFNPPTTSQATTTTTITQMMLVNSDSIIVRELPEDTRDVHVNIRGRLYRTSGASYDNQSYSIAVVLANKLSRVVRVVALQNNNAEFYALSLIIQLNHSGDSPPYTLTVIPLSRTTDDINNRSQLRLDSVVAYRRRDANNRTETHSKKIGLWAAAGESLSGRLEQFTMRLARNLAPALADFPAASRQLYNAAAPRHPAEQQNANPAFLILDILRGQPRKDKPDKLAYGMGLTNQQIDTDSIARFAAHCANANLQCNASIQDDFSLAEALEKIAAVGEGWITYASGKIGCDFDQNVSRPPAGRFSEDNIIADSFQLRRDVRNDIGEFTMEFPDADSDHNIATQALSVPNAPLSARPSSLPPFGVTRRPQAVRALTAALRELQMRDWSVEFKCDFADGINLSRGDAIYVSHDAGRLDSVRMKITGVQADAGPAANFAIAARPDPAGYYQDAAEENFGDGCEEWAVVFAEGAEAEVLEIGDNYGRPTSVLLCSG